MNPPPPLPFPGGRAVSAWWRELTPYRPLRFWLAHLRLHRVEALALTARTCPLDALRREVIRSLAAGCRPEGLDPGFLSRLTRELTGAGLLAATESGPRPTDAGRQSLQTGVVTVRNTERREFCFLDNREVGRPPHALRVLRRGTPADPPGPWDFDPGLLRSAVRQGERWKEGFGVPADVTDVCLPGSGEADWRSVVLDRAEHLFAAVVEVPAAEGGPRLLGFAARTEGWLLDARHPAIEAGEGWEEALPDLAADPPEEAWRAAWHAWGQPRSLPAAETRACQLEQSGHVLRVSAPPKLIARLRETRSDALKGEAWILAGAGRARAAARVELTERAG
jgi:hypothetical protein